MQLQINVNYELYTPVGTVKYHIRLPDIFPELHNPGHIERSFFAKV